MKLEYKIIFDFKNADGVQIGDPEESRLAKALCQILHQKGTVVEELQENLDYIDKHVGKFDLECSVHKGK